MPLVKQQLLLIHGWGMNKAVWHQLEQVFQEDIKVICVDLPGYGDAKNLLPEQYTTTKIAQQLANYLNQAEQTIILGWSMGGLIAIELAKLYPQKVASIVLVASNPQFVQTANWPNAIEKQILIDFSNQLKQDIKKTIKRFIAIQAMGSETARQDIKIILSMVEQQAYPEYSTLNKGLDILLTVDLRNSLLSLTLPILMITGDRDSLVNIKALKYLSEQAPNLCLEVISGAGHAPFISHFEQFTNLLRKKLAFE
ncbi:MAG: pimeloyl-ACP methyl ester esterase BioH [Pseudomonadota bacterium]